MSPLLNKTILLVEDEPELRSMVSEALHTEGSVVLEAKDGLQAIKGYIEHFTAIDFVVTDYRMPHINGIDLYHIITKINPHAKVLLTTGYPIAVSGKLGGIENNLFDLPVVEKSQGFNQIIHTLKKIA